MGSPSDSPSNLSADDAIARLRDNFPFEGYVDENLAPYHTIHRILTRYGKPGDRLLDFGSGPCDKTAIASAIGFECDAYDDFNDEWYRSGDNHERIRRFASQMGIALGESLEPKAVAGYDIVMMNDVLEHLHDSPRHLMNDLLSMIKPNGLLFLTVPNLANLRKRLDLLRGRTNLPRFELYYWYRGPWRGPVREYVRADLQTLVTNLGLELVELSTTHHMLKNLHPRLHGIYRAITRIFPDLADTWVLVARRPPSWEARTELDAEAFARIYSAVNKPGLY